MPLGLWCARCFFHMFGRFTECRYPGVAQLVGRLVWELEHGKC